MSITHTKTDNAKTAEVRLETCLGPVQIQWARSVILSVGWCESDAGTSKLETPTLTQTQQRFATAFQAYTEGKTIDFGRFSIQLPAATEFTTNVWQACRNIPYGETLTYGQLAKICGKPGAARAVGSAMSKNQHLVIVPCHRVVGVCNRLGGYSSSAGTQMKRKLLELESGLTNYK